MAENIKPEMATDRIERSSFLRRNLDHIVSVGFLGGLGAAYIVPNILDYVNEGHQHNLETAIHQSGFVATAVAMYYVFRHYYKH